MIDDPHGPLYSVVCTDTNPYGTWQVEFLEHTWLRASMPGELIRLVGAAEDEPVPTHTTARVVRTSATNTHPLAGVEYPGFNRLHSLHEWLENERPVGTVLILDSDFVFRGPITGRAHPGTVTAQEWWHFGVPEHIVDLFERLTDANGSVEAATWPLLIHTSDLRALMPTWLDLTGRAKRDDPGLWEADMFAFVYALREQDLQVEHQTLGAWMDWPEHFVAGAPIIHYCQPVTDHDGNQLWYKQGYEPWSAIDCDPADASLDYCRDLLRMLQRYVSLRRFASGER